MMHIFSLTPTFAIEDIDSNVLEKQDIANIPVLIDTENKKCEDNTKEEEIKQKDTEQKENPGASNEVSDTTVNEITEKNNSSIENKHAVINIDSDTITLDLSNISSSSGIHKVILPNGEEIISPKEDKITYKVKYNDTYTFKIIDNAGNSTDVNIEASNLKDKYQMPDTSGLMSCILSLNIVSLLYGAIITLTNNKK